MSRFQTPDFCVRESIRVWLCKQILRLRRGAPSLRMTPDPGFGYTRQTAWDSHHRSSEMTHISNPSRDREGPHATHPGCRVEWRRVGRPERERCRVGLNCQDNPATCECVATRNGLGTT